MSKYSTHVFILLFLLCGLSASTLSAQRFKGGIVAGVNLAQLDGDLLAGYNQAGLLGGLRASADLGKMQMTMEMLYSRQGSRRSNDDDPNSIYERINLDFVEVPVLFNFKDWKFNVYAGASYGRLFGYKVIDQIGENITEQQDYNPDIFAGLIGLSLQFTKNFAFDLRWTRHLNNLQADQGFGRIQGRHISIRGIYTF